MSDSTQHTPGLLMKPSSVGVNLRSYGQSAALCTVDGRQLVAGCFGDVRGGEDQADANARRLVAVWNACEGVPTEEIEDLAGIGGLNALTVEAGKSYADVDALKAQRDELVEALGRMVIFLDDGVLTDEDAAKARALVAKHRPAAEGASHGCMSDVKHTPAAFLGVTFEGNVNTVAVASAESVMEALRAGEIIVPCTVEDCRHLWGRRLMEPVNLAAAIARSTAPQQTGETQ